MEEYQKELTKKKIKKLREIESQLPRVMIPYLDEKELTSQINTVCGYAYDLLTFCHYLEEMNPKMPVDEVIDKLTAEDINEYQKFLSYNDGENAHSNGYAGIARRMSALRGFYKFATLHGYLKENPTVNAASRKRTKKRTITRLDTNEAVNLLTCVKYTDVPGRKQKKLCMRTKYRDIAIITLLLNTGIRVSECVGLDLNDVDIEHGSIHVVRKGGFSSEIFFNEDVASSLARYIDIERPKLIGADDNQALFVSMKRNRMSVCAMEALVKKYSAEAVPAKHITPHKLRSTYGTALYNETGDIYLVADTLGHSDINTTASYYAAIDENRKRQAGRLNLYSGNIDDDNEADPL